MDGILLGFLIILVGPLVAIGFFGALVGAVMSEKGKKRRGALIGLFIGINVGCIFVSAFFISPPAPPKEVPVLVAD